MTGLLQDLRYSWRQLRKVPGFSLLDQCQLKIMRAVVAEAVSMPACTTFLFVPFAGLALVLGMVGFYGVVRFVVAKRTREIGVRIALGTERHPVLWLVLKKGARFSLAGIGFGLAGAFVVTPCLASELYGVGSMDPATYVGVAILVYLVTLFACDVPARRAMGVDPLLALPYK